MKNSLFQNYPKIIYVTEIQIVKKFLKKKEELAAKDDCFPYYLKVYAKLVMH